MSTHLERCIRAYVAEGSGLEPSRVRPGNTAFPRGEDPFATLLLVSDRRRGSPHYHQLHDGAGLASGTLTVHPRRATYSLQFYREGADDLANAFDYFADSEMGLLQARTSFGSANGRVREIHVINGGSGYDENSPPSVSFRGRYGEGSGATATATVSNGAVTGISLDSLGQEYVDLISDDGTVSGVTIADPPSGETATAGATGFGFEVVQPLTVNRLDQILGDKFEERAQIDLSIDYSEWDVQDTGRIDSNECVLIDAVSGERLTG